MEFDNNLQNQDICDFLPPDWEITPLLNLLKIKHGYAFKGEFFKANGELILMTPGHFDEQGGFRYQKEKTKYYVGEVPEGYLLSKGDLLVAMTEQKSGLLGSSAFVPESGTYLHNQRLGLIEELDKSRLDKQFLFHVLNTTYVRNEIAKTATGSKVKHTSPIKIRSVKIALPLSTTEQKKIAYVLSTVQSAIAQQEQIIQTTTELKKALMQKLFTEGLHGEKQKETAIGLVPESWDVVRLDSVTNDFQYGTSVKCDYKIDGVPVLRIPNVVGGHVDTNDLKFGNPKTTEIEKLPLQLGDLLFVRTNGVKENAGRCSMYREEIGDSCYYASYLIRVRLPQKILNPEFLEEYSRTEVGTSLLSGQAIRTADGKFNINSGTLKRMLVPKPDIKEQREIANIASLLDSKIRLHKSRKSSLSELFQTLLHHLMTAKTRVHNINLPGFDDLVNITPQGSTQGTD